jgi:outer membrane assembly lipoprotein YfiO
MWTPETNKWENPKFSVKDTPGEQLELALDFYKSKQYQEATRELNKLIKHYPRAREAPEAQYYIALISEEQGDLSQAFKQYQLVIDRYPFSERARDIIKKEYDIGIKLLEGNNSQNKFVNAVVGGDYNVIDVFRTVIKNAPYGELAAPSQYKVGLFFLEKGMYQESRDEFEKLINDYPDSEWVKAAKYQIAVADAKRSTDAQYDQKVTQAAAKEFKEFVSIYPDAEFSDEAKVNIQHLNDKEAQNAFLIAQFYEKQKSYQAAKVYYQAVVDGFENTVWAAKALEKIQQLNQKIQ